MTFFIRLFENSIRGSQTSNQTILEDDIEAREFYQEVLLSYRLIFDVSGGSRPWLKDGPTLRRRGRQNHGGLTDPLLQRLCAPKCASEPLYAEIQVPAPRSQYTVSKDFPFLGHRLAVLQEYIMEHNPTGLPAMFHDRRDTCKEKTFIETNKEDVLSVYLDRYWTFWAVVWLGGTGVFLSIIQIVVGIIQVAKK